MNTARDTMAHEYRIRQRAARLEHVADGIGTHAREGWSADACNNMEPDTFAERVRACERAGFADYAWHNDGGLRMMAYVEPAGADGRSDRALDAAVSIWFPSPDVGDYFIVAADETYQIDDEERDSATPKPSFAVALVDAVAMLQRLENRHVERLYYSD